MKGFIYPLINVQDNKIFCVFQLRVQLRMIIKGALNNSETSAVFTTLLNTNTSLDESQDLEVERAVHSW